MTCLSATEGNTESRGFGVVCDWGEWILRSRTDRKQARSACVAKRERIRCFFLVA